jgi:hypothetical protein
MRGLLVGVLALVALVPWIAAQPAPKSAPKAGVKAAKKAGPKAQKLAELSKALKPLLADALPIVLYEKQENWGRTRMVAHAVHWRGLRPEIRKTPRNDGAWRKIKITNRNPRQNVDIRLHGLKQVNDDTQTFKTDLGFLCGVEYDQQNWESGIRLWSGSVRARLRIHAHLDCENVIRVETGKSFLPDIIFRLRVTKASVWYDDLVVEHIAGIGGTAAEIIGDAFHDVLRQWRPSVERDLLARANAAIVKAADTREVRIGLSGLFKD